MVQRTKPCAYCRGSGKINRDSIPCAECGGAGVVCFLCWEPPALCECAPSRFDGDPLPEDKPVPRQY